MKAAFIGVPRFGGSKVALQAAFVVLMRSNLVDGADGGKWLKVGREGPRSPSPRGELGREGQESIALRDVRFVAGCGLKPDIAGGPFRARLGHQATSLDHHVGAAAQ
jgi:hypothetical protein